MRRLSFMLSVTLLAASAATEADKAWPRFGGPHRSGRAKPSRTALATPAVPAVESIALNPRITDDSFAGPPPTVPTEEAPEGTATPEN